MPLRPSTAKHLGAFAAQISGFHSSISGKFSLDVGACVDRGESFGESAHHRLIHIDSAHMIIHACQNEAAYIHSNTGIPNSGRTFLFFTWPLLRLCRLAIYLSIRFIAHDETSGE